MRPRPLVPLFLLSGLLVFTGSSAPPPAISKDRGDYPSFSRRVSLMGTEVYLEVQDPDRRRAFLQLERMIEKLEAVEQRLSTWRKDSRISRLNAAPIGQPVILETEDCRLFQTLFVWQRETGGAFDPAVGRLEQAWGLPDRPILPSSASLRRALRLSGLDGLTFDSATCRVARRRDVAIDCGGFGKGEALDRMREILAATASPWLVSMGGQFMIWKPEDAPPWEIGVAHPRRRDEPILKVSLREGSLAVSGTVRDQAIDGQRISHILNPATGRPAAFDGSVAVWHESGLAADILSTALYVMGPAEGLDWAGRRNLAACFLILKGDGSVGILPTSAWRRLSAEPVVDGEKPGRRH